LEIYYVDVCYILLSINEIFNDRNYEKVEKVKGKSTPLKLGCMIYQSMDNSEFDGPVWKRTI